MTRQQAKPAGADRRDRTAQVKAASAGNGLRPYQSEAVQRDHQRAAGRGQLLMACGTGKTPVASHVAGGLSGAGA